MRSAFTFLYAYILDKFTRPFAEKSLITGHGFFLCLRERRIIRDYSDYIDLHCPALSDPPLMARKMH